MRAQKGEVWINTNTDGKDGYAVMTGCPTLATLLHAEMRKFNEEVK